MRLHQNVRTEYGIKHVSDDVEFLTYDEIAERFEITRESARQMVLRKHWTRRKGNDGRARIEVPSDAFPSVTSNETPIDTAEETSKEPSDITEVTRVLTRHIERLEQALAIAEENSIARTNERDIAREEARAFERDLDLVRQNERLLKSQLDSLQALMEADRRLTELGRQTGEQLQIDRDQWRDLALRPWWRRLVG